MNYATTCKFCHKPITLEIDDAYAELGDPYKLLPYAACNRCADLRVERRTLEDKIKRATRILHVSSKKSRAKLEGVLRGALVEYTKKYAQLIARWHNQEGMTWDEECVNMLIEHPDQWNSILGNLWRMYRQWEAQGEVAQ